MSLACGITLLPHLIDDRVCELLEHRSAIVTSRILEAAYSTSVINDETKQAIIEWFARRQIMLPTDRIWLRICTEMDAWTDAHPAVVIPRDSQAVKDFIQYMDAGDFVPIPFFKYHMIEGEPAQCWQILNELKTNRSQESWMDLLCLAAILAPEALERAVSRGYRVPDWPGQDVFECLCGAAILYGLTYVEIGAMMTMLIEYGLVHLDDEYITQCSLTPECKIVFHYITAESCILAIETATAIGIEQYVATFMTQDELDNETIEYMEYLKPRVPSCTSHIRNAIEQYAVPNHSDSMPGKIRYTRIPN
ncbi:hypothetical protein BC938DRAFT_482286 [Jimgerdemannia flammicorona]|uniref:Uncharacterized protein n=1 Tax=Jimgerdemannia flammicorona TaxID=994334 RepID=A0A433QER2_9FUNG|nr:hypothetical protein BC938DRAFT_482286 [Jimgerdemannia flammicorona]